jgi:putative membrane protein
MMMSLSRKRLLLGLLLISQTAFASAEGNHPTVTSSSYAPSTGPGSITGGTSTSTSTTTRGTAVGLRRDSIQKFLSDLGNLQTFSEEIQLLTPTHSKRDSSFTKSWTNEDWERHQVRSFHRYLGHMQGWAKSPTALAVFPTVAMVMLWSLVVSQVSHRVSVISDFIQTASFSAGISSFAGPISLLLALRTNRALNRLFEARSMFGKMVRATGSLASLTTTYIAPLDEDKALLMGRYLSIYGWIMKGMLRGEEDAQVIRAVLPPEEAAWLEATPADSPTSILLRLRQLVATVIGDLPMTAANGMEDRISELEMVLGVCKRLLGSPIPPTYTRHTSRALCLYLGLLPFALVGAKVPLLAILVNVALLSYIFVGIDEIGVEIEHPFPLLPMHHLSLNLQKSVGNQFIMLGQRPPSV